MINSVRETVHDFLEKNNRGWLKPERFNNYAYLAQLEIYESYCYDYVRWVQMQNNGMTGSGYADIPRNLREKLDIFHKVSGELTYVTDRFRLPTDHYRVLDVFWNGEIVDEVSKRRQVLLAKSRLTCPTEDFPVFVREESFFVIYPSTINDGVTISYLRLPAIPNWTYNSVLGNPEFDASAADYRDFEIHRSDEYRLVIKILSYAGVSIREEDVVQYAEAKESQKKQNENRA